MTRQEFIDNVTTWYELKDFCYEENCYDLEEIYDKDTMDEYIYDGIRDFDGQWWELASCLNDIPQYGDYFLCEGYLDWTCVDDDFDYYKSDILDWADRNDVWDEEEEDEEEEDQEPPEFELQPGFAESLDELMGGSVASLQDFRASDVQLQEQRSREFDALFTPVSA